MTAIRNISRMQASRVRERNVAPTNVVAESLVVRWEISPKAIQVSPLPAISAMNGQAEKIGRAALEWRVEGDVASALLRLEIGEDDVLVPLVTRAAAAVTHDGAWRHIEVDDRLVVTVRGGVVVYARTSVLTGLLGLRGGVYELPAGGIGIPADDRVATDVSGPRLPLRSSGD